MEQYDIQRQQTIQELEVQLIQLAQDTIIKIKQDLDEQTLNYFSSTFIQELVENHNTILLQLLNQFILNNKEIDEKEQLYLAN